MLVTSIDYGAHWETADALNATLYDQRAGSYTICKYGLRYKHPLWVQSYVLRFASKVDDSMFRIKHAGLYF
jgi:hypothetical protein